MPRNRKPARAALLTTALAAIGLLGLPVLAVGAAHTAVGGRYVTTWTGPVANLCLYGAVDVAIEWGDGSTQQVTGARTPGSAPITHTFTQAAAPHEVTVTGLFDGLGCPNAPTALAGLLSVDEWGATGTSDLSFAFSDAHALRSVVAPPDSVTTMRRMFAGSAFNQPIGNWDITGVTDTSGMFYNSPFNQPIGGWDTSSVTDMSSMFVHTPFNQPAGGWDTSNVTDMSSMFLYTPFNQPVGGWDTSNVTDSSSMFGGSAFNQPIGGWSTTNIIDMSYMFGSSPFNQPIGTWDTGKVTEMQGMFGSSPFNRPLGDWYTGDVRDMSTMFAGSAFNQPIGRWDTGNVTTMRSMFAASAFNQPIGDWNTSNVTDLNWTFEYSPFNQPIGEWDTSRAREMVGMFEGAAAFDQDLSTWCVPLIPSEPSSFDEGAVAWTLPRPAWGTCAGVDVAGPEAEFTSVTSTDQVRARGTATDNVGVARVLCAIHDRATGKWLRRDRTWGAYDRLKATLSAPGEAATDWFLSRRLPPGSYTIKLIAFDVNGNVNARPRPFRIVRVAP